MICVVLIVAGLLVSIAEMAWAQAGGGLDDLRMKGETKGKQVITAKRATKKQIAIGVGSVVVAILVLKYF